MLTFRSAASLGLRTARPSPSTTTAALARTLSSSAPRWEEAALNRAERLKSRFWKTVTLQPPTSATDGFQILLDSRAIRTPSGQAIVIPKERELLATCIAQEWSEQDQVLKPHTLPLTSLAARALEGCKDKAEREGIEGDLLRYLENETIWYVTQRLHSLRGSVERINPC